MSIWRVMSSGRYSKPLSNLIASTPRIQAQSSLLFPNHSPSLHRILSGTSFRHFCSGFDGDNHIAGPEMPPPLRHWGIQFVPRNMMFVIERFGKFKKVLKPGIHFLFPLVDRVAHVLCTQYDVIFIQNQPAVTKDNVVININVSLFYKIVDAELAAYCGKNAILAIGEVAQKTMRRELEKITLDKTFEERLTLSKKILMAINEAAGAYGLKCSSYEILNIVSSKAIAMKAEAEKWEHLAGRMFEGEADPSLLIMHNQIAKEIGLLSDAIKTGGGVKV